MIWVSAIVRSDGHLLMVRQRWEDSADYWYIPGGRIEDGESPVDALARELREETGLTLIAVGEVAYAVPTGTVFEVARWSGVPACEDPDGLVSEACFVPWAEAIDRLGEVPNDSMREPLRTYLRDHAPA